MGNLEYGYLIPSGLSMTDMGKLDQWHILIQASDQTDLESLLKTSSYVQHSKIRKKGVWTFLDLTFLDATQLCVILTHSLCLRHSTYEKAEKVLESVFINQNGLKIVRTQHSFEYHWLQSNEKRTSFPEKLRAHYLVRPIQEQVETAQYICQKYKLAQERLLNLILQSPAFRSIILRNI